MLRSCHTEQTVLTSSQVGKNAHVTPLLVILNLTVEFQLRYLTRGKKNYRKEQTSRKTAAKTPSQAVTAR